MSNLNDIGWVDLTLLAVLLASVIVGLVRGLVFEVLSLLGWLAAYIAAQAFSADVAPHLAVGTPGSALNAGAAFAWSTVLYLRPGTREHFLEVLGKEWPELTARYEAMYRSRAYLAKADTEPVQVQVRELKARYRIGDRRMQRLTPPPEPVQLDLAV